MKQPIIIDVELKDFLIKNSKTPVVIVVKDRKWQGMSEEELLRPYNNKIQELEDKIESFKLDNQEMKYQIEKFKKALLQYGFNLINGGDL